MIYNDVELAICVFQCQKHFKPVQSCLYLVYLVYIQHQSQYHYISCLLQDGTIRIWDTVLSQCKLVLSGHAQSVTCLKWGGSNLLYTGSQDRTVKVWRADDVGIYPILGEATFSYYYAVFVDSKNCKIFWFLKFSIVILLDMGFFRQAWLV